GYRSNNALIGSGEDIVIPRDSSGQVDFEGELVAVVGRRAKDVSEQEALDYVAGYTLGNDVSERSWQRSDRTLWRAKNSDTFKPMGPRIVSGIDPMNQVIEVRVNGRRVASYNTSAMIFGVAHFISRVSRDLTVHPNDVIWFGCDGPTEPALKPGDLVEVVNDAIGGLADRVVSFEGGRRAGGLFSIVRSLASGLFFLGALVTILAPWLFQLTADSEYSRPLV